MRQAITLVLLVLVLSACRVGGAVQSATLTPGTTPPLAATASATPTHVTAPKATPTNTSVVLTVPAVTVTAAVEPAATAVLPEPLGDAMATVAAELAGDPPLRDDVRLAVAYGDYDPALATPEPTIPPELGETAEFYIGNVDDLTVSRITAELSSIGERAYFWFDQGEAGIDPDPALLKQMTGAYDAIYDKLFAYFGDGQTGKERDHIVHASPLALCETAETCRLAGYFSGRDMLPRAVFPSSNERSMFVMNAWQFGTPNYLDVLAHELRHLLGAEYDRGEQDWFVEGAAMLAEDLVGFTTAPQTRGNLFLTQPDQQLTSWTDGNTIPYYGQGYLLNRFLYDRLGAELYHTFTRHPAIGLAAIDAVAEETGLDLAGESLWLDWLVAMALSDRPDVPERWRWDGPELTPTTPTSIDSLPAELDAVVSQYAADYYDLPSGGTVSVNFDGQTTTPLLQAPPPSGDYMWYAQRANGSNPRLTRAVDLRSVDQATLNYRVYADIEQGYDFAYVSASTDGGRTWQALTADGMQGSDPADDPGGNAYTDRFYTGRNPHWVEETVDLSPFAGQEILLRFEYVTDLILTYGGLALDDIAIPEIGFSDDAEALESGWTSEGFVRATADVPQRWHLQLVTFDQDGRPSVTLLPVDSDGRAQFTYQGTPGFRRPLLIVAATAPETLETAAYHLALSAPE